MLSLAFRQLHLEVFLTINPLPNVLKDDLLAVATDPHSMNTLVEKQAFKDFIEKYDDFSNQTYQGVHGTTAEYWMKYVMMVEDWEMFARACKANDVELYVYSLQKMVPFFFACNKPNYSRWMTMFVVQLINMDKTHPGVRDTLAKGALSIRRTSNNFSRAPVDMTLEQTINQDAASGLTGIAAFQQSTGAKNRWSITRSARSEIVSALMEITGQRQGDDVYNETKPGRVKRDQHDLETVKEAIKATCNPFTLDNKSDDLVCLSTGKVASEDVKSSLLTLKKRGEQQYQSFARECVNDGQRFEKSIKRNKNLNFASQAINSKITTSGKKILEVKGTRDLFGRLLFLAYELHIDFKVMMEYPLTPVPLTLADVTGAKHSTAKSALTRHIEKNVNHVAPESIDVYIVDAMYLICTLLKDLPTTYGSLVEHILKKICIAKRVDFVCDTYPSPSIKDEETQQRGDDDVQIVIHGAKQKRPKDMTIALKSARFKKDLLSFITEEWRADKYSKIVKDSTVYINCNNECKKLEARNWKIICNDVQELRNSHAEGDTLVVLHANHVNSLHPTANVVVHANDTDVVVLLLYHMHHWTIDVHMDVGLNQDNSRRYIHISNLAESLERMALVLPALHAFTGSDYTAAFIRRGKLKLFDRVKGSQELQDHFCLFGSGIDVQELIPETEKLVCAMYGKPRMTNLGDARYAKFKQKHAPSRIALESDLARLKRAESSWLPPSKAVIVQKVKRTNYVTAMWKNAHLPHPVAGFDGGPLENGWKMDDGHYKILWFQGEQLPPSVLDNMGLLSKETDVEDDDHSENPAYDSDSDSDLE